MLSKRNACSAAANRPGVLRGKQPNSQSDLKALFVHWLTTDHEENATRQASESARSSFGQRRQKA
jgi:hypothetical protein